MHHLGSIDICCQRDAIAVVKGDLFVCRLLVFQECFIPFGHKGQFFFLHAECPSCLKKCVHAPGFDENAGKARTGRGALVQDALRGHMPGELCALPRILF